MRHQPVYHDIKTTPYTNKQKHGFHRFQFGIGIIVVTFVEHKELA